MAQIGKLKPKSKFTYSGRMYQLLSDVGHEYSRFRIQEYSVNGYRKIPNRTYAFCFDTGQLGSFKKDTAVRPVYTVAMPIALGEPTMTELKGHDGETETPMTDSSDTNNNNNNIDKEEEERRSRNVRNLALKVMVEKFQIWEQKCDEVMDAKARREQAAEAYDVARGIAYDFVKEGQIETGRLVRGTYIIEIFHNSIKVLKGEILE